MERLVLTLVLLLPLLACTNRTVVATSSEKTVRPSSSVKVADMQAFHDAETIGDASASVVTFLDNDRFAFGALFSSLPDANAGREFRATIRSNAALAVVDAKSGTIQQVKLWSALKEQSAMFEQLALVPDGSGGMLFALGDRLVRLSPNLEQLAERPLPLNRIERN